MKVTVLKEAGYEEALRGLSYSFKMRDLPVEPWWDTQYPRAKKRAVTLAHRQGGHNKFLESITVWLDIEAPRAWWSEFDTYRVGTTKQSESTMHTLSKRAPNSEDFEEGTTSETILAFQKAWEQHKGDVTSLKMNLPEGFLQRRLVVTNYKVLQNIVYQRRNHRLKQWAQFCEQLQSCLEYPEFLDREYVMSHAYVD